MITFVKSFGMNSRLLFSIGLLAFVFLSYCKSEITLIRSDVLRGFQAGGNGNFGKIKSPYFKRKIVKVTDNPEFTRAFHVQTIRKPEHQYSFEIVYPIQSEVKKGDVLHITFWLKAVAASDEANEAQTNVCFQQYGWPWKKSLRTAASLAVGQGWKKFEFPFRSQGEYPPGKSLVSFEFGFRPQTIELGGIQLINYGKSKKVEELPITRLTYEGREKDAKWRQEAFDRIEKIRKDDIEIQIVDSSGRPVKDAAVDMKMTKHLFPFGSEVNAYEIVGKGKWKTGGKYSQTFKEMFNLGMIGHRLCWPSWEDNPKPGIEAAEWLKQQNVDVWAGHLIWPTYLPEKAQNTLLSAESLRKMCCKHIADETRRLREIVDTWFVLNEVNGKDGQAFIDRVGKKAMIDFYHAARKSDPDARLIINDCGIVTCKGSNREQQDRYYNVIEYLLKNGAPLDGMGIQSHFRQDLTSIEKVKEILDRFARLNIDILVTEYDITAPDEQLQADYTRDYLIMTFSHPSIKGFCNWGFWESSHWSPQAALLRSNWLLKPAGKIWMDLVYNKWWTMEKGSTDEEGIFKTRGFKGKYIVTVQHGKTQSSKEFILNDCGATLKLILD